VILGGCQVQGQGPVYPDKKEITARELYRTARSKGKILIVDGWKDQIHGNELRKLIKNSNIPNWEIVVKHHDQVTRDELANLPTMLVGTPSQNSWMKELLNQLPIKLQLDQLELDDMIYQADSHVGVLSYYPNPLNVRMPLGVYVSSNEKLVWDLTQDRITSFIRGSWHYEILRGPQRVLLGNFSQKPSNRWNFDKRQRVSLPVDIKHQWESNSFNFSSYHQELNPNTMEFLGKETQRVLEGIEDLCSCQLHRKPINYYLYPTTEIKGLMTGNTDQSHMNVDRNEVHTAFEDHFGDSYFGEESFLLIDELLGMPSYPALRTGLAVYFSENWQKHGYQYWAGHLIEGGNGLTITQLLDSDVFNSSSSLIRQALSGSLVEFLIDQWGKEKFLENYRSWNADNQEMEGLTKAWWTAAGSVYQVRQSSSKKDLDYLRGFNFTHEGYRIFNGYGSKLSENSMKQLQDIGANAVAIVPYSWMRNPSNPTRFPFSSRAGAENDEGVIHAICEAQRRDFYTILKPHVWISGSWPGEIAMTSEEDWDRFFEYYFHWISHYAFMAEIQQVDMLSIGVEFSKATMEQEERWVELIDKVRGIYRGHLIYSANWGDEFESIGLWKHLDYIGLNCYYPLSDNPEASQQDLVNGFKDVMAKVGRIKTKFGKPVVLTEIGFRSIKSPWIQPHAEAGESLFSELDQALAYEAVFQAVQDSPGIDGILWWKWPTHHLDHAEGDRRFVPSGKKATQVIKTWYNKELNK
jgi:hypothetical protein